MKSRLRVGSLILCFLLCCQGCVHNKHVLMDQGKKLYAEDKYKQSQKIFSKVLKIDEQDAEAHYYLGKVLLKLNDLDGASKEFSSSLKINPRLSQSFSHLGIIAIMKKDYEAAVTFLRNAILYDPADISALNNLGFIFLMKRDYGEALKYYTKSQKILPDDPIANLNLAEIFRKVLLDKEKAVYHYQKYLGAQTQETATALEIRAWLQKTLEELNNERAQIVIERPDPGTPTTADPVPLNRPEDLDSGPENGLDVLQKIQYYETSGDENYNKALLLLLAELEKEPGNALLHKRLVFIYLKLGSLKQAIRELKIVKNMGMQDAETRALWDQINSLSENNTW
ncbi:tetratricopeptide repeat protein [candidate division CSSED10-310 bacterium]|uniref:Tetratricopeptide repeat protein n=1 Tax=candidate division CSSED10-310 bacterium TaxID=2855610 RepID=A0ABV6Z0D3_UNCC1